MFFYKFKNLELVFVFNQKCGCSTIKNIINQIDNLYNISKYMDVHNFTFSNTNIKEIMTKHEDCHVIFFIRNPYDRFISGYSKITNKLILNMKCDLSKSQEKCNKIVNYGNISIEEWANIIKDIKPRNLDLHFIPQTYNIRNLLNHNKIKLYDIENLDNIDKYINNLFQINIKINIHPKYNNNYPSINHNILNIIYQYYNDDFNKLGYNEIKDDHIDIANKI